MQGRLEILAVSVHAEGDTSMDHYDEHDDMALQTNKPLLPIETETDPAIVLCLILKEGLVAQICILSTPHERSLVSFCNSESLLLAG
ncbi:hypothetical protein YC2023_006787 [Brassica napus]